MNQTNCKRVLLISNSTLYGSGYLDHAESEIRDFLGSVGDVLFIPFALYDRDAYAATARERFEKMGYALQSIHSTANAQQAVNDAEAIFIGGGNTFRLLKALYDADVLQSIRRRVAAGMPYIGSSAGSNVAGETIRSTNDMPVVEPPTLSAADRQLGGHRDQEGAGVVLLGHQAPAHPARGSNPLARSAFA